MEQFSSSQNNEKIQNQEDTFYTYAETEDILKSQLDVAEKEQNQELVKSLRQDISQIESVLAKILDNVERLELALESGNKKDDQSKWDSLGKTDSNFSVTKDAEQKAFKWYNPETGQDMEFETYEELQQYVEDYRENHER